MKRQCEDGAVQKCEYDDTISGRKCSLGNCPKLLGDWTDQDECKPFNALKKCGPGTKTQKRACEDGTFDICTSEDTIRNEECSIECEKRLGPWRRGKCIPKERNSNCGEGTRSDQRACYPGTNDPCLDEDTIRTISCSLSPCTTGNIFAMDTKILKL